MSIANEDRSWIIREKATGKVMFETFNKSTADKINRKRYEAVPIREYLASLNRKGKRK